MSDETGDRALMLRFQSAGDFAAFEELFRRHRDGLFGFLVRLAIDRQIAEEVSQRVWLKLVELARRGGYRPDSKARFRTFLFTLARNEYIDQYVRKHEVARTEPLSAAQEEAPGDARNGKDEMFRLQLREHIDDALATLPFEQREVITLWAAEYTIEQMVAMTGAPRDTVLSRKKYALQKLRRYFESIGVGRDG